MSLAGEQLGHYRLLRLLGSGGMGEVYLAEDARIGQQVAIKVIRSEGVAYPGSESAKEAARLFEREAKAIARLDHPNILPLYAYGEEILNEQPLTYLVMPYRKEGTLATWLRRRGGAELLSPSEVAPLLQQAADALQHAHNRHIIHQDIKPTNFLIRQRDDQPDQPDLLLADFGIAKLTSATASASQSIRGTPTYMAPEQWDGHPVPATDQYALAIMVYELLVGHPPFQGGPGQVMRQHYMMSPPVPSTLNPHLSPAVDAVLLRALAKQPEERFPSVIAFARAFQEAVQHSGALHATLAISRTEAESGTMRQLTLPSGRKVSITIPAGVSDGTTIRLEGHGEPYYEGGPAGPLVLKIAIPAEASPPPPQQDSTEPTVAGSLPILQRPSIEEMRPTEASTDAPADPEPTTSAPSESRVTPSHSGADAALSPTEGAKPSPQTAPPAPPLSPSVPGRAKRRLSPSVVVALILATLIVLGGVSFGIYAAATGKWPGNQSYRPSTPTSSATSTQANDTATVQSNVPGSTWTAQNSGTSDTLYDVIWSGTQFVVVGDGGTILTSPDGKTWTAQTSGISKFLTAVVWSGTKFVAVGVGSTILTSLDGHTWTAQTSGTSYSLIGITWSGSQFVAVGYGDQGNIGTILTSPDGTTWTAQTFGTSYSSLIGITWSGSQFEAVGEAGTILTSPNGSTWTAQQDAGIPYSLSGVVWSGTRFVAVGAQGTILTSPDGRTWTAQTSGISINLNRVTWSGTQFVVVGEGDTILTSPDGSTWTAQTSGTSNYLNGVAWSGSQFVAVGGGGTILTSS